MTEQPGQSTADPKQSERSPVLVAGEALQSWPEDLYIPPDALEVILDAFQGPLDLLLYLIRKQNIDILDIPVAEITRQYMEYVELMRRLHLDLAAEYLVMAAMLAEIKSRMLLPRPEVEDEDGEDPRAVLVRRLQEYERFRSAAEQLDSRPRLERDLYVAYARIDDPDPPKIESLVDLDDLVEAMKVAMLSAHRRKHLQLVPETLSVRDRMGRIMERVRSGEYVDLKEFFDPDEGRMGLVVSFIAVLELVRDGVLIIIQNDPGAPILEAALFSAEEPLSIKDLRGMFKPEDAPTTDELNAILDQLTSDYHGRGIELVSVANGYRFQTQVQYATALRRLRELRPPRYSRALLETLAIIAYRQPVTRGDVEEIRGVAVSTDIMRVLLERGWVRQRGEREVPGRPVLYGTTTDFLEYFNLKSIQQLPELADQRDLAEIARDLNILLPEPRHSSSEESEPAESDAEDSTDSDESPVTDIDRPIKSDTSTQSAADRIG
ncbi:MAG TPA: SMC-Scp complex subunit ScpB [Gammaproteobacteria bacterium]|nr:SMC-Scp complex subunit ScpB [Gammaproteobacteria bacterium]